MISGAKKILVVAAHPDDEALGAGGTILKHVAENDQVSVLILSDGELSRGTGTSADVEKRRTNAKAAAKLLGARDLFLEKLPDNAFDSVPLLSIAKIVETYVSKIKPDIIYTHHGGDLNVDHRLAFQAVITACRPQPGFFVKKILSFEVPSSTEWNAGNAHKLFAPNFYNDIGKTIDVKIEALQPYKDEMRAYPHPRSFDGVRLLAKYRGMTVGYEYAEAFEIVRELND